MTIKDLILDRLEVPVSQFCKECGVNRTTIDNIIHDKGTSTPSLLTIKKICKYFDVEWRNFVE